jgi:hypothetical protein
VVRARRATAGDSGRKGRRLDPSLPPPRGCRREAGADASASSVCRRAAEQGRRPARLPETRRPGSPQPPLVSPLPNYGSTPSSAGATGDPHCSTSTRAGRAAPSSVVVLPCIKASDVFCASVLVSTLYSPDFAV